MRRMAAIRGFLANICEILPEEAKSGAAVRTVLLPLHLLQRGVFHTSDHTILASVCCIFLIWYVFANFKLFKTIFISWNCSDFWQKHYISHSNILIWYFSCGLAHSFFHSFTHSLAPSLTYYPQLLWVPTKWFILLLPLSHDNLVSH